jgi:hypothetical protein
MDSQEATVSASPEMIAVSRKVTMLAPFPRPHKLGHGNFASKGVMRYG